MSGGGARAGGGSTTAGGAGDGTAANRPPSQAARPRGARLAVQANTLWTLTPETKWCSAHPDLCKRLGSIDLTGAIGSHAIASLGCADAESDDVRRGAAGVRLFRPSPLFDRTPPPAPPPPQAIDFTILDVGGIHVHFTAEGTSNPLDSPSVLFLKVGIAPAPRQ